jgi:hypothetical protein
LGCRFGFDQFRCTRPPKLVVGRGSPRPCRPAALLQVVALLPVGSDISQGSQVCLRIAVLHELLHTDRREDFHDCGASLLSRKFVGGCAGNPPPKENPMTIDATAPIAIPSRRRVRDSPWRIDGICIGGDHAAVFYARYRTSAGARGAGKRPVFIQFEPDNFLRLYQTAHSLN